MDKKSLYLIVYVIGVALIFASMTVFPSMGADVLKYKFIEGGCFVFYAVMMLAFGISSLVKELKATWANKNAMIGIAFFIIVGLAFIYLGGSKLINAFKDKEQGYTYTTIYNTDMDFEKRATGRNNNSRSSLGNYRLTGITDEDNFEFNIKSRDMYNYIMDLINETSPEITVIYYENTNAIVQLHIHNGNEIIVMPGEDEIIYVEY